MVRKGAYLKARQSRAKPRWPREFRHLASFLFTPHRWVRAQKVHDLLEVQELEQLRADVLLWLYQWAKAPTVWPDGARNVLAVGTVLPPTSRRILRRVNKSQGEQTVSVSEYRGEPAALSFAPVICEIAYELAGTLGVPLGANGGEPGVQRAVQSIIQRVINALAQEETGAHSCERGPGSRHQ